MYLLTGNSFGGMLMEPILENLPEEPAASEAQYTLESPIHCNGCRQILTQVEVVRILRTKVNFTSALPRRGYVVICPKCRSSLPATLG